MKYSALKRHLLEYPGSELSFPFDAETAVFKVGGKMFALVSLELDPLRINLKCRPLDAQVLRDQFPAIQPGYHMNKEHWNSVYLDGSLEDAMVKSLIADSYHLTVKTLTRKGRDLLGF